MPITYRLRNGNLVNDQRLARQIQFDERSRQYPIMELVGDKPLRSYTWRCKLMLNQGQDGSCVGCGITHELAARPAEVPNLTYNFAKKKIYWKAQEQDEWDSGSYHGAFPQYEGTSVLAGVKVAHALGYFKEYRWAFSFDELLLGIAYHGPAVLGIDWREGMFSPDEYGFIYPTGETAGGHCILANGVNLKDEYVLLHNSWGAKWGKNGEAKIGFNELRRLLQEDGEAVFFVGRKSKVR